MLDLKLYFNLILIEITCYIRPFFFFKINLKKKYV
jgi:hypothetical protein